MSAETMSMFEQLDCFLCRGYLSSSPILLLPNEKYICGRCSFFNTDTPVHRILPLEVVLNKMSFPCIYKNDGCLELILFGKTAEHEAQCVFRPFSCPSNFITACIWRGCRMQMLQHFKDDHPELVKQKIEFLLELTQDSQGFLMSFQEPWPIIVKYFYKVEGNILRYDVRWCSKDKQKASWNTQVTNATDLDFSISCTKQECLSYDESFFCIPNVQILEIGNCLKNLKDPKSVLIEINVKFVNEPINDDTIKNLKCNMCHYYLIPPLFYTNDPQKIICGDCAKTTNSNCASVNDANLLNLVQEAMFPCLWRGCNFIGKSSILKNHVANCEVSINDCPCCKSSYKFSEAVDHLQTHINKYTVYMPKQISYKVSFAQKYLEKYILTIKNKKIVMLIHSMKLRQYQYYHQLEFKSVDNLTATIHFEHEHCRLTSKPLKVKSYTLVAFQNLPSCFKNTEELTAIVEFVG